MVRTDNARRTADQQMFERAVKVFGTYSELARRLGVHLSTLHGWKRRGSTPPWRAKEIRALAKRKKLTATIEPDRPPRKRGRGRARKRVH